MCKAIQFAQKYLYNKLYANLLVHLATNFVIFTSP